MNNAPPGLVASVVDPLLNVEHRSGEIFSLLTERGIENSLGWKDALYYNFARPFIPVSVRRLLQSWSGTGKNVGEWYLPQGLYAAYVRLLRNRAERIVNLWPEMRQSAIVLTHDVESAEGFAFIERIAKLEEAYGFRSSWNVVLKKYLVDWEYLRSLQERGHEVGIHGYNHDGRDIFSRKRFIRRADEINGVLERESLSGYRAPATLRNADWFQYLRIVYDASCFDVDPFQRMAGGTGSIWPFFLGRYVELPYTVPQDHVLYYVQKEQTNVIWKNKANWLHRRHGMILTVTHPDYLRVKTVFDWYEDFLAFLRELENCWLALPSEVASWWQKRSNANAGFGTLVRGENGDLFFETKFNS